MRLSGIIFQHDLGTDDHVVPASAPGAYAAGQSARFTFQIASGGSKSAAEQLEMRTHLFRDRIEVWESAAMPVETNAKNRASFFARGAVEVPNGLDAGKYMVRVDITDKTQPVPVSAWQWTKLTVQ